MRTAGPERAVGVGQRPAATIDLGTFRYSDHGRRPPWMGVAGPDVGATHRPLWRSCAARTALAAVAVVALGGGGGPGQPELAPLWTVPDTARLHQEGGSHQADGAHLYVSARAERGWTLTAYRLADGAVAWESRSAGQARLTMGGGAVLGLDRDTVTAYDPRTGAVRWSHPGRLVGGTGPAEGLLLQGRVGRPAQVAVVDLDTGALSGVVRTPADERVVGRWRPYLFTVREDGMVSRYHLAEGTAEPVRARIAWPGAVFHSAPLPYLVDRLVVVGDHGPPRRGVVAYDAATLAHRWAARDASRVEECGPVLCLYPSRADLDWALRGVDPDSGAVAWSIRCADVGAHAGCRVSPVVRLTGDPDGGGLLVRLWQLAGSHVISWVMDPRTGRPLGEVRDGWLAWPSGGTDLLLTAGEPGRPARTWWARADPQLRAVQVLGSVGDLRAGCEPAGDYLLCRRDGHDIEVWRLGR